MPRLKSVIVVWLVALLLVYIAIVAGMYAAQRGFLYFPEKTDRSPEDVGLSGIIAQRITTNDGETLQAWYSPAKPGKPTILHFHGNAGSISGRGQRLQFYQQQGFGALFVSYRGYGSSSGAPTETGLINDALASFDWLLSEGLDTSDIAVIGESLGAAVALQLAIRKGFSALVMEAPFTSTVDVAKTHYWWLPVNLLMKDRFESIKLIKDTHIPVLVVHGELDEITNVAQGKQLYEAANSPKQILVVKDGSHNGIFTESVWLKELAFINKHIQPSGN